MTITTYQDIPFGMNIQCVMRKKNSMLRMDLTFAFVFVIVDKRFYDDKQIITKQFLYKAQHHIYM